jgi:hypothetical protein
MTIECAECKYKDTFLELKDALYSNWKIVAWNVDKNIPICICPECEYGKPKKKIKK